MPTRKIGNLPSSYAHCRHPDHDPATMIVREPGIYEHTCPACGQRQTFLVESGPRLSVPSIQSSMARETLLKAVYGLTQPRHAPDQGIVGLRSASMSSVTELTGRDPAVDFGQRRD